MDMQLIGEMNPVDVFLVSIGDNFTMGVDDAVKSVEFVKPKLTIPMHYNTFDVIKADANDFKNKVNAKGYKVELVGIGESYQL